MRPPNLEKMCTQTADDSIDKIVALSSVLVVAGALKWFEEIGVPTSAIEIAQVVLVAFLNV